MLYASKLLSLVLILVYQLSGYNCVLKFAKVVDTVAYDLTMDANEVALDAFRTKQTLIRVLKEGVMKLHCEVEPVLHDNIISTAELCWKKDRKTPPICADIIKHKRFDLGNKTFEASLNETCGFTVTSLLKPSTFLNGYFFCHLGHYGDSIKSNVYEFQNVPFYQDLLLNSFTPHKVDNSTARQIQDSRLFELGRRLNNQYTAVPIWLQREVTQSLRWRLCPAVAGRDVPRWQDCMRSGYDLVVQRDYLQHGNGSIELFRSVYQRYQGQFVLQSSSRSSQNSSTMTVYRLLGGGDTEVDTELVLYSALHQTVYCREGDSEMRLQAPVLKDIRCRLTAAYSGKAESFSWSRQPGSQRVQESCRQNGHWLELPRRLSYVDEGNYELQLMSQLSNAVLRLRFTLVVIGSPAVLPSPVIQLGVTEVALLGEQITLHRRVEGRQTRVTVSVTNVPRSAEKRFQWSKTTAKSRQYIDVEVQLNTNISVVANGTSLTHLEEEHTTPLVVTLEAQNNVGFLRLRQLVMTVRKPRWRRDLTSCNTTTMGNLSCGLFQDDDYRALELYSETDWWLDGQIISPSPQVQESGLSTLTIYAPTRRVVRCRVRWRAPVTGAVVYDSDNDPTARTKCLMFPPSQLHVAASTSLQQHQHTRDRVLTTGLCLTLLQLACWSLLVFIIIRVRCTKTV